MKSVRSFFKEHSFYAFLLGNLAYMLLLWALCPPRINSNDDFCINAIAAGALGAPSAHVVYANVLVGLLLRGASALVPGVNWFWVLLLVTTLLAYSWAGVALQRRLQGWCMAFYLPFVTVTGYAFYVLWTYTRTASLAAAAGWLCWLDAMGEPAKRKKQLFAGSALILLGLLIRWESFLMVTGLAVAAVCGFLLSALLQRRKIRLSSRKAPFLLAVVLCAAVAADSIAYSSPAWHDFRTYDKARQQLFDYNAPNYARNAEELAALGLSEEDYTLATNWTFADPEKLNTDTLTAILALRGEEEEALSGWTLQSALVLFVQNVYLLLGLLYTILFLCLAVRFRWLPTAGLYGGAWLLLTFLVYRGRYPDRVLEGLGGAFALLVIGLHSAADLRPLPDEATGKKNFLRGGATLLSLAVAVPLLLNGERWLSPETYRYRGYTDAERAAQLAEVDAKTDPSFLYLQDVGAQLFFWDMYPLWGAPPAGSEENFYSLGGWHINMPVTDAVLQSYGVQNPMASLGENDRVLLIDSGVSTVREKVEYVRRNYHPDVTWSVYETVMNRWIVSVMDRPTSIGSENPKAHLTVAAEQDDDFLTLTGTLQAESDAPDTSEADTVSCLLIQDESGATKAFRIRLQQGEAGGFFTVKIPLSELVGHQLTVSAAQRPAGTAAFADHTPAQSIDLTPAQ